MLSSCRILPTRVGGRPGRARLPYSRFYPRLVVHEIGCRTLYTMCFRVQTPGLGMAGAEPASTKWPLPIGATALHCAALHCTALCCRSQLRRAQLHGVLQEFEIERDSTTSPDPPWLGSGERCFSPVGLCPPDWLWALNTTCFVFQSPGSRAGMAGAEPASAKGRCREVGGPGHCTALRCTALSAGGRSTGPAKSFLPDMAEGTSAFLARWHSAL